MKPSSTMLSFRSALIFLALLVAVSAGTNKEGLAFLAKKSTESGVVKLESGLMYKVLSPGISSNKKAKINTPCVCHYAGTLIDGTEFDSSYKRGQVIRYFACIDRLAEWMRYSMWGYDWVLGFDETSIFFCAVVLATNAMRYATDSMTSLHRCH